MKNEETSLDNIYLDESFLLSKIFQQSLCSNAKIPSSMYDYLSVVTIFLMSL